MEISTVVSKTVEAKTVEVHVKVCDSGSYKLRGKIGEIIAEIDQDYVPGFFPGDHYGDYLLLSIDLETGQILNWKKPSPESVAEAFKLTAPQG